MITVKVRIDTVDKVKDFSSIVSKANMDCELVQGVRIIDAKSIMGIFSLDLSKPIELRINSDDRGIVDRIKDFVISNS